MNKFYIKTLGCKTNQLESGIIEEKLINAGYVPSKEADSCDIYVLNSCSVTHATDEDSIRLINHIKKINPDIFVVLTGCFAQLQAEKLKENEKHFKQREGSGIA